MKRSQCNKELDIKLGTWVPVSIIVFMSACVIATPAVVLNFLIGR